MTRRIIRLSIQLSAAIIFLTIFIFLVDNRYRVLPVRIHEWSPIHHPGHVVIDVTLTTCSAVSLFSSCNLGDEWSRVEKDLYLGSGWVSQAYVHVKRKKEQDLTDDDRIVLDMHVGRLAPGAGQHGQNEKWESRPGGLWILRSSSRSAFDGEETVTAVDVLFGADAVEPRIGWTVKDQAIAVDGGTSAPEPRLSVRKGPFRTPDKPVLRLNKDGKFKVLQISDMHLSTGLGKCRDEFPANPTCDADPRTMEFIGAQLDIEQPDLVVLSGDQINGETSPDAQTTMFKVADLFVDRRIPYAMIFGNHDDEGSLSRAALMQLAEALPYSVSEAGPATVDGVGNYYIEVLAKGTSSSHSALTLWLLDTHAYSPDETHYKGYDWLKPSQINWFRDKAASLRTSASHKEYAHTHLDMAFIHIPLPEYREIGSIVEGSGEFREPPTAPGFNAGFKDALIENGVMAVSCGHDHVNDYCIAAKHSAPDQLASDKGDEAKRLAHGSLWMCYAGGSGYGGYAGYGGFRRRLRVWEFEQRGSISTWVRVDGEEGKHHYKQVVQGGKAVSGRR